VSDELRARLRDQFNDKELAELTNFIAWENARARFNRGFDIQSEGYTS
jgi:alkylhydroperoxidase family enzyme